MSKAFNIAKNVAAYVETFQTPNLLNVDTVNVTDINSSNNAILKNLKMSSTSHEWTIKGIDSAIGDTQAGVSPDTTDADSGQLAIYNGATKLWGINESGWPQNPNVPSFFAWNTTTADVSGSQGTILTFENTLFNNGGHYNTTTYKFTAPISGIYKFTSSALYRQSSLNNSGEITFYKNGANIVNRGLGYSYFGQTSSNYHGQLTIDCLLNLSAGDYIYPAIWVAPSGTNFYIQNGLGYFNGYLIG